MPPSSLPQHQCAGFRRCPARPRQGAAPPKCVSNDSTKEWTIQNIAEFRIIGRIGIMEIKDKVATLNVAANYDRKAGSDWEGVTCFGKNIDRAAKMAKGDLVHITGRVRQSRYDREGQTVYSVDLIVDRLTVIAKNGHPADDNQDSSED